MSTKISIIVPVFNAEPYLTRCVDSILAQTVSDWELLLIDDGSTDSSPSLCNMYAEQDKRIRVVHQPNAGVSAARNKGIDEATGNFIGFVDADDWLEKDALSKCAEALQNNPADMLLFDPFVEDEHGNIKEIDTMPFWPDSICLSRSELTPERLRVVAGTVWRCVYSRTLIQRNHIRFHRNLPLSEDRIFNIEALGCSKSFYYLKEPLYHYIINSTGAVHKYRPDFFQIVLDTHTQTQKSLKKYWNDSYLSVYTILVVVDGALISIYNTFSPKSKDKFRQKMAEVKRIVSNDIVEECLNIPMEMTIRRKLLKKKAVLPLCFVGLLWNIKNR